MIAAVQFLAPEGWRNEPPTRATVAAPSTEDNIIAAVNELLVQGLAVGAHIWFACSALSRVVHPYIPLTHQTTSKGYLHGESIGFVVGFFRGAGICLVSMGVLVFLFLLLKHILPLLFPAPHSWPTLLRQLRSFIVTGYRTVTAPGIFVLYLVVGGCITSAIFLNVPLHAEIKLFLNGGGCLVIFSVLIFFLLRFVSVISENVHALHWLSFPLDVPQDVIMFPFLNFLIAFLYYRLAYDPRGTFKPAWTENLG